MKNFWETLQSLLSIFTNWMDNKKLCWLLIQWEICSLTLCSDDNLLGGRTSTLTATSLWVDLILVLPKLWKLLFQVGFRTESSLIKLDAKFAAVDFDRKQELLFLVKTILIKCEHNHEKLIEFKLYGKT